MTNLFLDIAAVFSAIQKMSRFAPIKNRLNYEEINYCACTCNKHTTSKGR